MDIPVLLDTHGLLILNKPAGIVSQGSRKLPIPEISEYIPTLFPGYDTAHRIDRFTSGILVCANQSTRKYLAQNWHHVTHKLYLAIIREPLWDNLIVDQPIDGKSASTSFEVLERQSGLALVMCELVRNGRRHQIRRHLKNLGLPIVGDRTYRGRKTSARNGQLLHSWIMTISFSEQVFALQAPIPDDFRSFKFEWSIYDCGASDQLHTINLPNKRKQ